MKVRKFFAASSREALRQVREALGADAVVLSNRVVDGGVELVALAETDLASLSSAPNPSQQVAATVAPVEMPARGNGMQNGMQNAYAVYDDRDDALDSSYDADPASDQQDAAAVSISSRAASERAAPSLADRSLAAERPFQRNQSQPHVVRRDSPMTPAQAQAMGLGAPSRDANGAVAAAPHTAAGVAAKSISTAAPLAGVATPSVPAGFQALQAAQVSQIAAAAPVLNAYTAARPVAPPALTPLPITAARSNHGTSAAEARTGGQAALSPQPATQAGSAGLTAYDESSHLRAAQIVADNVIGEIQSMRGALEEQLSTLMWTDRQRREPVRARITKTLLSSGFSAQLVRLLLERMPVMSDHEQAMDWVRGALARNLPVIDSEDALMERGGVFALTGPTGVGKTTTTAKLAARCVMRFGADRVALLTTDSYRIGAHEQLRIYGKILGVSVHAVKDGADLRLALSELRNKHMVLIDTIGMSQRDRNVADQVAMLTGSAKPVQRLLLLNATSHGDTLNEVVHAYRNRPGTEGQPDLAGCILTKLDEATNLGAVLDTVVRYRLPVHYVSTGQKVPENLYVARKQFLIKSAFCIPREHSPFVPHEDDFPTLLAGAAPRSNAELKEVQLG